MGVRYVDKCSDCGQGLVIIMKDELTNNLILICDECEAMWKDPDSFYLNQGRIPFETKLQLSEEVSIDEIISVGWEKFVKNIGNPIDL